MLNKLKNFKLSHFVSVLLIVSHIILLISISAMAKSLIVTVSQLNNKITIYSNIQKNQITNVYILLKKIINYSKENDEKILKLTDLLVKESKENQIKYNKKYNIIIGKINENNRRFLRKQENNFEFLNRNIKRNIIRFDKYKKIINLQMNKFKTIDIDNVENIKSANFLILNYTAGIMGSGSHIKINNKHYILTVAHLLKEDTDTLKAVDDNNTIYDLKLVKKSKKHDLSLFEVRGIEHLPFLEISSIEPKLGSVIMVIGNPSGETDIVTNGIISKIKKNSYIFTNIIYFGNSGGAVLYKGKIIGVTSRISCTLGFPTVNRGISSNIKVLKEFLKGI